MQSKEEKVDSSKALDASLVVTECSAIDSDNNNSEHAFNNSISDQQMTKCHLLRWIPAGKMLMDSTTKVDSEPPNGSNDDITNPYHCDQTLNVIVGPAPTFLTPGQISSWLIPNLVPAAPYVPPTNKELEILFQPMYDEYLEPPHVIRPVSPALAVPVPVNSADTPSSTTIDQDAPSPSHSPSSSELQSPSLQQGVAAESTIMKDNSLAPDDNDPFVNVFPLKPCSEASSSRDVSSAKSTYVTQTHHYLGKWCKDHPLDNVIGNL
uniref:Integrase, catalytic region, zinc finger, CCHC-type, peptidase aspartic, catalytic n=1 Tax=Tanacetum cinerariifolium TaxID=118510 RepID=A0A699I309_TANCI|nr:hypothetical protein [Tanacetum cinerariifolium]GEZ16009.1 hypothetical protein [Tanacetum cinerariifolium]